MTDTMDEATRLLQGQREVWELMFGCMESMALKCAVELGIADIIHSHDRPLSVSEIASNITNSSSSLNIPFLNRVMNLLVYKKIFTSSTLTLPGRGPGDNGGDTSPSTIRVYGPTVASRWLMRDTNELNLAPLVLWHNHPILCDIWHQLSGCIREGGTLWKKAYGLEVWEFASQNPVFNQSFNEGMACTGKITVKAILSGLKSDAWEGLESVVDVGGGTGGTIAEIVKAYPHIRGINFDLPHVVETAPQHIGVSHVGGDMFDTIPTCQAVLLKWILHCWNDEQCEKILKNCRKAIPEKTGKLFIVDLVLEDDGDERFGSTGLVFDMITHSIGGKERTASEWKSLVQNAGFHGCKITKIPALYSVIEAYPN